MFANCTSLTTPDSPEAYVDIILEGYDEDDRETIKEQFLTNNDWLGNFMNGMLPDWATPEPGKTYYYAPY